MICGALQTLNEDAFEDVAISERPSPSNGSTGELFVQQQYALEPIREDESPTHSRSFEDFFDKTSNNLILNNNVRFDDSGSTVIMIPNCVTTPNIDDTSL